jgi:hypothetical protein
MGPHHGPERDERWPADSLRFRLYVAGELVDEQWAAENGPELAAGHQRIAEQADAAGKLWLVEVFNPDEPEDAAYFRFGTDTGGMVAPAGPLADYLPDILKGDSSSEQ